MTSKRVVTGPRSNDLHQTSLFRYTKPQPRKSTPSVPSGSTHSALKCDTTTSSERIPRSKPEIHPLAQSSPASPATPGGSNDSGNSRGIKENLAPDLIPSSIPSVSGSLLNTRTRRDKSAVQRDKRGEPRLTDSFDHENGFGTHDTTVHTLPKRRARQWAAEEPGDSAHDDRAKRRRITSDSDVVVPHQRSASGGIPTLVGSPGTRFTPLEGRRSSETEDVQHKRSSLDSEGGFGSVVESSQTQPLLTPERSRRPTSNSPAPIPSQARDGLVRSSQSPSPLKFSTPAHSIYSKTSGYTPLPFKSPLFPSTTSAAASTSGLPVQKRRRVPEGSLSAGSKTVVENGGQDLMLNPNVKRIRRPGRYSIPDSALAQNTPALTDDTNVNLSPLSPPKSKTPPRSPTVSSSSPHRSSWPLADETRHELERDILPEQHFNSTGPFWETQPLLELDVDVSSGSFTSHSPSSLPRMPSLIKSPTSKDHSEYSSAIFKPTGEEAEGSFPSSETEQDSPIVVSPFSARRRNLYDDPDKTAVASTPTRHLRVFEPVSSSHHPIGSTAGNTLVAGSSPDPGDDAGTDDRLVDGDKTIVNHQDVRAYGTMLNGKDGGIQDVTRALKGLSPFKRVEKRARVDMAPLRLHDDETIVIEDEEDEERVQTTNHYPLPLEETQNDPTYSQAWPGASLPPGWKAILETPKKPVPRFTERNVSKYFRNGAALRGGDKQIGRHSRQDPDSDGQASDDAFGPEVTPRTAMRERPDVVRAFEAQASPFPGMFSGSVDGESESELES